MRGFIECCCGLYVESLARQVDRDIRHEVLTTGKKPRDAFAEEVQVGQTAQESHCQDSGIQQGPASAGKAAS